MSRRAQINCWSHYFAVWALLAILLLNACNLTQSPPSSTTEVTTAGSGKLVIAWAANGNLMVWQEGDDAPRRIASGGVIRPYLSPSGTSIAFTRGPVGAQESLWVVDTDGSTEQELAAGQDIRSARGGQPLIDQVEWLDDSILYFNSLQRLETGLESNDDLYRVNIRTREVAMLLRPTEGGRFAISPDHKRIVLVYHGTYGRQDGRIRAIDLLGQAEENLRFFVGVSTASEYSFYPLIHWKPDSSAVLVALPDKDLIYDDVNAPPAALWLLPVGAPQERAVIGSVPASFFGLPRWSDSTEYMTYMRRIGDPTSNRFELVVAETNGENPVSYATGTAGSLQPAEWIPGTNRFIYAQGETPGTYWLGAPGAPPQRLPNEAETMFAPRFVDSSRYIFLTTPSQEGVQLRDARLDSIGDASVIIATIDDPYPVFDAILRPQQAP